MTELLDLAAAVRKAMEKAQHDLGRANLLIAGRTGVGKSTLINAIFRGRMAAIGQGKPVTKTMRLISKEGIPLGIWDTQGLEMSDFDETLTELMRLVEERAKEPEARDYIHAAWVCVHEDGRRVEAAEMDLCRALAQHMPVLAVITKARRDGGFRAEVRRLLPEAKNVCRVRAIAEEFDDPGCSLPSMGWTISSQRPSRSSPRASASRLPQQRVARGNSRYSAPNGWSGLSRSKPPPLLRLRCHSPTH